MAKFFKNQQAVATPRQALEMKYNSARANLLLLLAFTVINIILVLFGANTYFLFSASIPYSIVYLGAFFCGKLPAEQYEGTELTEADFFPSSVLVVMAVIAAVILALYFLCWLFSKQHKVGWLIFALVLFVLDTVMMFLFSGISFDSIFDILIHAWVLYYLIAGIHAHGKLKKLGEEEPAAPLATEGNAFDESLFTITEDNTDQK